MSTQLELCMPNCSANKNAVEFRTLMDNTMRFGEQVRPRGQLIRETMDAQIRLDPTYPFQGFKARKYDLQYFKAEMRWKLGASKYDDTIRAHAKMWDSVQNPDGTFNSNYGQFWFGQQMGFWKVVQELVRDKDSRRATIPMLNDSHLSPETRDTVCTEAVTFHIRNETLYMTVHMRSSDQIFGLGTDVPTFSVLFMLVYGMLKVMYPKLDIGWIYITASSSHIYERHFKMVSEIIQEPMSEYQIIELPKPSSPEEVLMIISDRGNPTTRVWETNRWPLYNFIYGV